MAQQVLQQTCSIPAGTTAAAPLTVALPFDGWLIEAIDLEVPAGPNGTVGFYLANNAQPWVPRTSGEWFVWDDRQERFYTDGYPTGGGWAIVAYNEGAYAHDVIVRFHVNAPDAPADTGGQVALTFVTHDIPAREPVTL